MAARFTIPETHFALDFVRPDFILLRMLGRSLIMWDGIEASEVRHAAARRVGREHNDGGRLFAAAPARHGCNNNCRRCYETTWIQSPRTGIWAAVRLTPRPLLRCASASQKRLHRKGTHRHGSLCTCRTYHMPPGLEIHHSAGGQGWGCQCPGFCP